MDNGSQINANTQPPGTMLFMERYKRIVDPVHATEIQNDGILRSFAIQEFGMTAEQVNRDIAAANQSGEYPDVLLSTNPPRTVRVGWFMVKDAVGRWETADPAGFNENFERDNRP